MYKSSFVDLLYGTDYPITNIAEPVGTVNTKQPVFHEPKLRLTDWDIDIVSHESNAILLPTPDYKDKSLKDILCNDTIPLVLFTSKCWQEVRYLADKYTNMEWAIFVTMKRLSNTHPYFLAFDWFMPLQDVSSGTVSVDAEDSQKYYDYLLEHYPYYKENGLHKYLMHLHSHNSMNMVNFSSIDDKQQFTRSDLGYFDDFRFYTVVTTNNGSKASFVYYNPVVTRVNAALGITWGKSEYVEELTKERKNEIDTICNDNIRNTFVACTPKVATIDSTGKTVLENSVKPAIQENTKPSVPINTSDLEDSACFVLQLLDDTLYDYAEEEMQVTNVAACNEVSNKYNVELTDLDYKAYSYFYELTSPNGLAEFNTLVKVRMAKDISEVEKIYKEYTGKLSLSLFKEVFSCSNNEYDELCINFSTELFATVEGVQEVVESANMEEYYGNV